MSFGIFCNIQSPIKLGKFQTEAFWGVLIWSAQITLNFTQDTSAIFGGAICFSSEQASSKVLQ